MTITTSMATGEAGRQPARSAIENVEFGELLTKFDRSLQTIEQGVTRGNPLQTLNGLKQLTIAQSELTRRAVGGARAGGISWARIAQALQVTAQSAHERYAQRID